MTRADLLKRLTNHLAGEASFDAIDENQRVKALEEAISYIAERWQLDTKTYFIPDYRPAALPSDDGHPPDFSSFTGHANGYNLTQPPLISDNQVVWGGRYPTAEYAISYYAAFRVMEDRGPELYERAMYWKQRFDQYAERLDEIARRRSVAGLMDSNNSVPGTFEQIRQKISWNLNQQNMTVEERFTKFPLAIIDAAINQAYADITNKFELQTKSLSIVIDGPGPVTQMPAEFVSPAVAYATLNGRTITHVPGNIRREEVDPSVPWYTEQPSFRVITDNNTRFVQFSGLGQVTYPATFELYFDAKVIPMGVNSDKPWNGLYDDALKLIIYKAMRDLMYGDAKTYNMSRFWQNEYDREEGEFKRILRRYQSGSRVVLWGYSRMNFGQPNGFSPIDYPDSRNNE